MKRSKLIGLVAAVAAAAIAYVVNKPEQVPQAEGTWEPDHSS